MKKILLIAAAIMAIVACGNKNSYVVTGTVEGAKNGDIVYLQSDQENTVLDSTKIENGKFKFTGVQKTPEIRYITAPEQTLLLGFVLESGDIELSVTKKDETDFRKGSKLNDEMQSAATKLAKYSPSDAITSLMYDDLSDEDFNAKEAQLLTLIDNYNKTCDEIQAANKDNVVGKYFAENAQKIEMPKEQISSMLRGQRDATRAAKLAQEGTSEGKQYTDFGGKTVDGKTAKLSDFVGKNKYVLIDFWASWCRPCMQEVPNVAELYAKYKSEGLEIVGVSLDKKTTEWKKAISENNMSWNQILDEGGNISETYGVNAIPHMLLIDKDGKIVARNLRGETLKKILAEVFGK